MSAEPAEIIPDSEKLPVYESFENISDPDALLMDYLKSAAPDPGPSVEAASVPDNLSGINLYIYEKLIPPAKQIASGEVASTEIHVDLSEYVEELNASGEKTSWTAADLGLDSLTDGGSSVSSEAAAAFAEAIGFRAKSAVHSLSVSCPYEFYWRGTGYYYYYPYAVAEENGEYVLTFDTEFEIGFSVSSDYAVPLREYIEDEGYDTDTEQLADRTIVSEDGSASTAMWVYSKYAVDSSRTASVNAALENASAILSEAGSAELGDIGILSFYRDRIHALAEYAPSARTSTYPSGYGDPWQIIYVFDGNPETNVVCEGFAKSFQYLCDLTAFENPDICCSSVTGYLGSLGAHMWNIVSIGGNNYFADITNDNSNTDLFLRGFKSGSVNEGYVFSESFDCVYSYDDETKAVCSEGSLTIIPDFEPGTSELTLLKNSSTGITVTWSAAENADGYYVFKKAGETDFTLAADISEADTLSWIDTGVDGGTFYSYKVSAYRYYEPLGKEYVSDGSSSLSLFCLRRPAITGFTSTSEGFSLTWTEMEEADGYLIYRKNEGGSYSRIKKIRSSETVAWTDTTVEEGIRYSYKVIAYRILNGTAYKSCASTAKTKYRLGQPAAPALKKGSGYIRVSWTPGPAADGYIIYRKSGSEAYTAVKTVSGTTAASWKDKSVTSGTKYRYKIKAYKKIESKTYYSICSSAVSVNY